ncbi:SubName: Full=Uncharacterized protein {ECO:0000313/EMBL:CCA75617.1} [Serendipita indica DSM 11827]|nr:SubName: Full=Uncharacterized protein {ECO:0000313/EMBL:CCA75617.1} [Serendipita indica DSM 11827]
MHLGVALTRASGLSNRQEPTRPLVIMRADNGLFSSDLDMYYDPNMSFYPIPAPDFELVPAPDIFHPFFVQGVEYISDNSQMQVINSLLFSDLTQTSPGTIHDSLLSDEMKLLPQLSAGVYDQPAELTTSASFWKASVQDYALIDPLLTSTGLAELQTQHPQPGPQLSGFAVTLLNQNFNREDSVNLRDLLYHVLTSSWFLANQLEPTDGNQQSIYASFLHHSKIPRSIIAFSTAVVKHSADQIVHWGIFLGSLQRLRQMPLLPEFEKA